MQGGVVHSLPPYKLHNIGILSDLTSDALSSVWRCRGPQHPQATRPTRTVAADMLQQLNLASCAGQCAMKPSSATEALIGGQAAVAADAGDVRGNMRGMHCIVDRQHHIHAVVGS